MYFKKNPTEAWILKATLLDWQKKIKVLLQGATGQDRWKMECTRTNTSQPIDLSEGIVLETGARLIKWKVILTRRGKLFANIRHWKLKMAPKILDIPQQCRGWSMREILRVKNSCFRILVKWKSGQCPLWRQNWGHSLFGNREMEAIIQFLLDSKEWRQNFHSIFLPKTLKIKIIKYKMVQYVTDSLILRMMHSCIQGWKPFSLWSIKDWAAMDGAKGFVTVSSEI